MIAGALLALMAGMIVVSRSRVESSDFFACVSAPCPRLVDETTKKGLPFPISKSEGQVLVDADGETSVISGVDSIHKNFPLGWVLNTAVYAALVYFILMLVQKKKHAHHRH